MSAPSELLWKCLARLLVMNDGWMAQKLIAHAMKTPHKFIGDYMERWWLLPENSIVPYTIRVHHFLRADKERDRHNHPWPFRTFIAKGWYDEEAALWRGPGLPREEINTRVSAGDTYARSVMDAHRVVKVSDGGVWTIVITGKKRRPWGFYVGAQCEKWVDADDYAENYQ